jgi:hypothetical protein
MDQETLVERDDWKVIRSDLSIRVCVKRNGRWIVKHYALL